MKNVCSYIHRQKQHHKTSTLQDEYFGLLREFNVPFDEKYVFD